MSLPCSALETFSTLEKSMPKWLSNGMLQNLTVANKLLYMYAQRRVLGDAYALFGGMGERDSVTWSVMNRDLVTWTVMIGAFAECRNADVSLVLFDWMIEEGVVPDKVAME
ncbi:pentatricopeptide repeat-containing protein [Prunus yedoensis var. nudiflora]|uniref:Pentatricopeptide repeat-containing protein n=1 Tax=Prunus yedoensis var. nudiflora TaxID=2094558 RepID=A0A314ZBP1_PRUYE|nr:pentatricopeptide repeat-containing protein [Prunus yedoensis var. nudiflora]